MRKCQRYLIFIFALCLSNVCFGQIDFGSDTTDTSTDSTGIGIEEERSIAKREGGSANSGTVFYFYENPINVGLPELRFVDTTKSLFHRYSPYMRDNRFRTDRGNVGLATEDLEFTYADNILFSYGKSPFELYRYTPFNTKFYQNVNPYVELFYVMGKEREQDFRVLFAQNVWQGLNVGAELNVINSPGVYDRAYTRHNNVRVFSNFISKDRNYRAVAGYYFNRFESNESGGITVSMEEAATATSYSNKKTIPVRLARAENIWAENSFYLKQSYHFGIHRKERNTNDGADTTDVDVDVNVDVDAGIIPSRSGVNFGYLSHALEVTRFRTMYNDRMLDPENYRAIYRDPVQTQDSTFVGLFRNTISWNFGDATSFQNAQFFNLSVGAIVDWANVGTGDVDTIHPDPVSYYAPFNRTYNYLYPFARLRLNYQNRYFLTAGTTYQADYHRPQKPLAFSANIGFDYMFDRTTSDEGLFAELNFSDAQPRPFQEFYISNSHRWDHSFQNTQTLHLAVGARWKGFHLRAEHATFYNYIYLTPERFLQNSDPLSVFKATLEKTFKFWSIMAFDTRLVYQLRPNETPMQLPNFSTRNALYFDFTLLQTTPVQVGVEMYYNTPYLSRFYSPELGSFFDQSELEIGGFTYVDVFLNLRVQRRANVFVKWANAGADWLGYDYMMTRGYPVVGRALIFGVLWRFYD